MILVILTALTAVCGAAKLDRSYLPPITAKTAGGSPGALLAPLDGSNGLPTGSYTNDAQGVVVDAVNPGTRTSGLEPTGLGGPRSAYGATNSKVGDAAFKDAANSASGFNPLTRIAPGFESLVASEGDDKTRTASLKFTTDVGQDNYSYGFETDNGISVGENGVATNGVQAEGGYSYKGDDGQTYSVTYTADEGGYKPQGQHLPTPPPIPKEILISLEKNAKEEAAGHVDDGSYDAQKYNDEGDYSNEAGNNGKPLNGDATASGSFVNQNNQAYRPTSGVLVGSYNGVAGTEADGSAQGFGQVSGNAQTGFGLHNDVNQHANNNIESQGQFGVKEQFSTENRFKGTPNSASHSFASASASSSPVGSPSFNSLSGSSKINSAFSSAVASGPGSASAFASTGPVSGFRNDYLPPKSFGSAQGIEGTQFGSDSSAGASIPGHSAVKPSSASASASVSPSFGQSQQFGGSHQTSFNSDKSGVGNEYSPPVNSQGAVPHSGSSTNDYHSQGQSSTFPSNAFASSSVSGNEGFQFGQKVNNFPSRVSETQTSQFESAGSASAKPVGSFSSGTYNENVPPVNIIESTGKPTYHSKPESADSSSAASFNANHFGHQSVVSTNLSPTPSTAGNFGVASQQTGYTGTFNSKPQANIGISSSQFSNPNAQFSGAQSNQPSIDFESQAPTKTPDSELSTPFESNYQTTGKFPSPLPTPVTTFVSPVQSSQSGSYQSQSTFNSQANGQYRPQSQGSVRPGDATFASSTQRPSLTQEQGSDDSYYYKQPSKPFVTPATFGVDSNSNTFSINNRQPNIPVSSQSQQGSKYSNTATFSSNGITQASSTSFSSNSPKPSSQFGSQPTQFGSKPTTSNTVSQLSFAPQASSQYGATGNQNAIGKKPDNLSSQSALQTQQYQGSVYEYNKPAESLPATQQSSSFGQTPQTTQSKPSQTSLVSKFGSQQGSVQFGSQTKPFGSSDSSFQSTQVTQTSAFAQGESSSSQGQFGQKPFSSQTSGSKNQQFGVSGSQFGVKPQTNQGTNSFTSNTFSQTQQQSGNKPSGISQTGPNYFAGSQSVTGQKTDSNQGLGQSVGTQTQISQKPFGSTTGVIQQTQFGVAGPASFGTTSTSNTFSLGQTQFGKQPTTGSAYQQTSGSQFGQKQQSTSTAGVPSFGQKPVASSQSGSTFQQAQFGSGSSSFGQKPQTGADSSTSATASQTKFGSAQTGYNYQKPQTGISATASQTSFGKKPVITSQVGSTFPQSQFSSTFSQKQQTGSSTSSFGQKPFGTSQSGSNFQSQFGTTGFSSSVGSGVSSTTSQTFGQKPFGSSQTGSSFQQSSFGQKQQGSQGSFPVVTTVKPFVQKPFGSSQTSGSFSQQSQFGIAGSKFGQRPQTGVDSSSSSTTSQISVGQKPFGTSQTGSTFQQSNFGQKQQGSQGSFPVVTTVKPFEQKPFGNAQTSGSSFQKGSSGIQTAQKPTSTFGSYSQSSQFGTQGNKPFGTSQTSGSTFQQTQFGSGSTSFGQKPQTGDSSSSSTTSQSSFGTTETGYTYQKPQTTAFGSGTLSKGQQNTQFGSKPFGTSQTTGSSFQQTQFSSSSGSQVSGGVGSNVGSNFDNRFGQAPQSGQKPFASAGSYQQGQVGTTSSQYAQKLQGSQASAFAFNSASKGQTVQTAQKPFGSIQTTGPNTQQSQLASSTGSQTTSQVAGQFGQGSFGQKPFGSSFNAGSIQQTQFSTSTGSKFGQTPQSVQGTTQGQFDSKPQSSVQTAQASTFQFGQKQQSSQGSFPTITTEQKPFGSSQASGSSFQVGSSGFQNTQKPTSNFGAYSQTSQFGTQAKKPFGSQTNQFGSTTTFGQKPQAQASAFASSTGFDAGQNGVNTVVRPVEDSNTNQITKYQQTTQFIQNQGSISTGFQKPFGGSVSQTNYQQQSSSQFGAPSRFGQSSQSNVASGLPVGQPSFGVQGQKPFGSQFSSQQSQTSAQQFGISQGSTFQTDQKTQPSQSNVQATSFVGQNSFGGDEGYNYQKPEVTFNPISQLGQDQKTQQSQTSFNSRPSVLAQGTGQSNVGSQSGFQSGIATGLNGYNGQPSATAVSTSQFGVQQTKPTGYNGQSFQTVSPTRIPTGSQNVVGSSSQFGVQPTQSSVVVTSQKPSQFGADSLTSSSSNQATKPTKFGASPVVPVPISSLELSGSYQGPKEQFAGSRDPPRFDDKTGYHY